MHPVEVLINLYQAQQAGATNPFNVTDDFCRYTTNECLGCPADDTCEFITNFPSNNTWKGTLWDYCSEYQHYTYDELINEFPEYQI